MSRAINLKLTETEVTEFCAKAGVAISAIEELPAGGTHVVLVTSEGAEEVRIKFKKHIVLGRVKRYPFYRSKVSRHDLTWG